MANLNGQNIGLNYKGILNLNGLNAPLSTTLQAVNDGDGVASPLQLSTTAVSINSALTVIGETNSTSLKISGTNGNGHIHLRHQASDAAASGQNTSLFADSNGDIKWQNANLYSTTLRTGGVISQNSVYTLPNFAAVTLAGINIAQTYTAIQTFQSNTFVSNLFHSGFVSGSWVTTPTGTANNTTLFYSTNGYLGVKIGTATGAAIFNTSAITTSDKTFTLPNSSMTLAGLEIAQTYTATQTVGITNTGTTTTSGFYLNATTNASGAAPVQNSPVLYFSANGWNNTTSTSLTGGYRMYVKSFAPANPPSFEMQFETISGGLVATLNTSTFTMIGAIVGNSFSTTGTILINSRITLSENGDGAFRIRNNANTTLTRVEFGNVTQGARLVFQTGDGIPGFTKSDNTAIQRLAFGPTGTAAPALAVATTTAAGDTLKAVFADGSGDTFIMGKHKTHAAYVNTTVTPAGYLVIFDSTGTSYRIPAVAGA
jgi:hypothetical protein